MDGHIRLDGGAMFGVVPKPLWQQRAAGRRSQSHHARDAAAARRAASGLLIIDAGCRRQDGARSSVDIYGIDRREQPRP